MTLETAPRNANFYRIAIAEPGKPYIFKYTRPENLREFYTQPGEVLVRDGATETRIKNVVFVDTVRLIPSSIPEGALIPPPTPDPVDDVIALVEGVLSRSEGGVPLHLDEWQKEILRELEKLREDRAAKTEAPDTRPEPATGQTVSFPAASVPEARELSHELTMVYGADSGVNSSRFRVFGVVGVRDVTDKHKTPTLRVISTDGKARDYPMPSRYRFGGGHWESGPGAQSLEGIDVRTDDLGKPVPDHDYLILFYEPGIISRYAAPLWACGPTGDYSVVVYDDVVSVEPWKRPDGAVGIKIQHTNGAKAVHPFPTRYVFHELEAIVNDPDNPSGFVVQP